MFNFLKEKLKNAVAKLTKGVEEKGTEITEEEDVIVSAKPKKEKSSKQPAKPAKKEEKRAVAKKTVQEKKEKKAEEKKPTPPKQIAQPQEGKKSFFGKLKEKIFKKETTEAPPEEPSPEEQLRRVEEAEKEIQEIATAAGGVEEAPAAEETRKEPAEETEGVETEVAEEQPEEKTGFFQRLKEVVTKKTLSDAQFEELFWELEVALLENNVAVEVIEKVKQDLKKNIVNTKINRGKIEETIVTSLRDSIASLFDVPSLDLLGMAKRKKPFVIAFVGVNGSGKTTTIAKLTKLFQDKGMKPVIAAADTFRAAAIQQLEEHANRLHVKLIKHDYGADPAAVAFDAIKYAEAHKADVVLIDTAGRLHSNVNLMDEMKKIMRVAKPDVKIFIGESITGNDCVEQAKQFNDAVGIDGIILCKADVDEKGGAAISVSYVTGKPILYLGVGQRYEDLQQFDSRVIMNSLGLA